MKRIVLLVLVVLSAFAPACQRPSATSYEPDAERINWVVDEMNELMMHDVTNPPLAARFFAYALLAGCEVAAQNDSTCLPLGSMLHQYPAIARPAVAGYSARLAALLAMLETAGKLQPSGKDLGTRQQLLLAACREQGMPEDMVTASQQYAQHIAKAVLAYAKQDGYYRISDRPRYTPTEGPGYWYPTPPGYFVPVEPYFSTIRPFLLDSAGQFPPLPPQAFDSTRGSGFYQLMDEVRQTSNSLTPEQQQIASFWDCNPFAMQDQGHLQVGLKKMSPGAHWMKIVGIACQQSKVPFNRALQIRAVVAMTITDAFICCWKEKYHSNRIRPETAIRRYLDPQWKPLLQTPPFPEYLSGHSVVSTAAAEVASYYFGPHFAYTDNTEKEFGLNPRRFSSFKQAAEEAAISRLYGGIHFRDAIQQGQEQGQKVGDLVVRRLTEAGSSH
jgi:hypothetical protein